MSKLWIVSFRVPEVNNSGNSGGLVVALNHFFNASAQDMSFKEIAFCGFENEPVAKARNEFKIVKPSGESPVSQYKLPISKAEHAAVYQKYLSIIWAMSHGLIDKIDTEALVHFRDYWALNARLASVMAPHIHPDDTIWIQDYQLFPLGEELRQHGIENKIGHFSHIPKERKADFFRLPADIRRHLERHENQINRGMNAYDLVGFQRGKDLAAFAEHFNIFPGNLNPFKSVTVNIAGSTTKLGVYPASIDANIDIEEAAKPITTEEWESIGPIPKKARIISWAGRADISKNIPAAYNDFAALLRDSEFVEKIRIEQDMADGLPLHAYGIAGSTRKGCFGYDVELEDIRKAHANLVEEHSWNGQSPATLNERGLSRQTLLKLYRRSTGYFISKRDGLLLGGSEHQVAQDPYNPNAVIMSEEAGAADNLPGALTVPPAYREACQIALQRALTMEPDEKANRHQANMKVITSRDSRYHSKRFISDLTVS